MGVTFESFDGLDGLFTLDYLPVGFKVWLRFVISAEIMGRVECKCGNGVDHESGDLGARFPVSVSIRVPAPIKLLKLGGPVATGAEIAYHINKFNETLNQYRVWFEPAMRVARESATLICQGRFNQKELAQHLADIVLDVGQRLPHPLQR